MRTENKKAAILLLITVALILKEQSPADPRGLIPEIP